MKEGKPVINGWCAIPSTASVEAMAHQGWDSLSIDMQHGVVAVAEAPFGGIKQTGYGREGGSGAIKDYLNVKYTHMGLKI